MTIQSLPNVKVYVAFNPVSLGYTLTTSNTAPLTSPYWTEISQYVIDFSTRAGKQHFLDRIESTALQMSLNNRTNFFNGGSGYTLGVRTPIVITATWPQGGTAQKIYFGLIDAVTEKITDQLNSELFVTASDMLKYLSLNYLMSDAFWDQYALSPSATDWFRCDQTTSAIVTGAEVISTGLIQYQAINQFQVGQKVSITGLNDDNFNIPDATVSAIGSSSTAGAVSFSISGYPSVTGSATGTGLAFRTLMKNQINTGVGVDGTIEEAVSFSNAGALIYSSSGAIDLAQGSTSGTGYINLPNSITSNMAGIDFWILGNGMSDSPIMNVGFTYGSTNYQGIVFVNTVGSLSCAIYNSSGVAIGSVVVSDANGYIQVADGYWHHVGLVIGPDGLLNLYCDGYFAPLTGAGISVGTFSSNIFGTPYPFWIGGQIFANALFSVTGPSLPAIIDEIIISNNSHYATLENEVLNRFRAGSLLQKGFPVDGNFVWSGNRIAEALCLAGFGSIVNGQVVVPNFEIANTYHSPTAYTQAGTNGSVYVEPYYWDAPITGSTALDLIQQITDTDVGVFYTKPDGSFRFNSQTYYGTWAWNGPSTLGASAGSPPYSGTWTPASITSSATLTDNSGSTTSSPTIVPYIGSSLQMVRDDADLWMIVKVTPQSGTDQIYENTGSENLYGYTTLSKSGTLHTSLDAALSTANYLGSLFDVPKVRVSSIELRLETSGMQSNNSTAEGYYNATILGLAYGDVITFQRTPPGTSQPFVSVKMIVESISHTFDSIMGTWHTNLILDPYPLGL